MDKKEQSIQLITQLYNTYKDDEYMKNKINNYILQQLPGIFENMKKNHDEKIQRIEDLSNEQVNFINNFLVDNQYFYIPSTEKFFFYDGVHYVVNTEDDILYHILSTISKERLLIGLKQKTKTIIMKRIKDNTLLRSVPESETIQNVIDCLYPVIFDSRTEAKYFLCVIGDNILKKNTELIHFINNNTKPFIRELNNISQLLLGTNMYLTFKHKYYEHEYLYCRLLKIKDTIRSENIWKPIILNNSLDLLCVACHYSNRYENADNFLMKSTNGESIIESVFYLKDLTQQNIVDDFVENFLEIKKNQDNNINLDVLSIETIITRTTQITWKDMLYLWKLFIETKNIPNVISQNLLKTILTTKNLVDYYKEPTDVFLGITSKRLPVIQNFIQFWNDCITINEDEFDYEIGELCFLYKKWNDNNKNVLNDKQIIDLISYFFPSIEIEKDKYIHKIFCSLWDKKGDIRNALDELKQHIINTSDYSNSSVKISIYDAYIFYCKYAGQNHNNNEQIVSKSYFEKYLFENLFDFIVNSKYISMEWVICK